MVRLEPNPEKGYALSVSNDGSGLPEGFDLADHKGLGMRLIQSLVGRIGGDLRIVRGDKNQGTRFTVVFSRLPTRQVRDGKNDCGGRRFENSLSAASIRESTSE